MMEYQLHPLCTFFPRMTEKEFSALVTDIQKNGLNHPITLLDGMILDGGNRYKACIEAGVTPRFVKYEGGDPVRFVLSENLERRHLDAGQRAAIVASIENWSRVAVVGENQHTRSTTNSTPLPSISDRAKESGVSKATQQKADAVAKANPELAKKVAQGDVSLNEATKQVAPQLLNKKSEPQPEPESTAPDETDIQAIFESQEKTIAEQADLIKSLTASDKDAEIIRLKSLLANSESEKNNAITMRERTKNENDAMYRVIVQAAKFHDLDHTQSIFALCKSLFPCFKKVA